MTAQQIVFPVVMRPNFSDPAWREQHQRECRAQIGTQLVRPFRTRPMLVIDNMRAVTFHHGEIAANAQPREVITRDNFDRHMRELCGAFAFSDDVDPAGR